MNDKTNILASLIDPSKSMDLKQQTASVASQSNRPTSGVSSSIGSNSTVTTAKQHKLKQRFNVIRKLGKGTYGKVQLAINKQTGQEVAIKTIKKTKIENEQDLQRVRREIQIMSSIEHPHITHIYEVFENKDKIVLVMQYAPGGELYEYVSQSKVLDDFEARRLFRQIATAIYYCHQNKICHRDLKLENILLDEKNNAKLADFGLSNVFDKDRYLKTFCGSPLYASPEIVQGSPYEGPEVDCWSLGVLLYTLVYGAMPFDGSNFKRLVKQISEACYFEPKQRSAASPLIRRLLCADPKKRATILDICSDPWVNGASIKTLDGQYQRISPNNEQQKQQQSNALPHNSLLQVAQDMATLTPVRLDILLALTPTSPASTNVSAQQDENKPPQPQQVQKPQPRRFAMTVPNRPPSLDIDPSLMMGVDETSHIASPVASYIVRDLDAPEKKEDESMFEEGPVQRVELEQEASIERQKEIELMQDIEPDLDVTELSVEPQVSQEVEIEAFAESTMASDEQQQQQQTSVDKEDENHSMSSKVIGEELKFEDTAPIEQSSEEVKMEVEERSELEKEPQIEKAMKLEKAVKPMDQVGDNSVTKIEEKASSTLQESEQKDKRESVERVEKDSTSNEEIKPKKVKKKIVVVKKRKKVAKKDAETVPNENISQQNPEQEDKIKGDNDQVEDNRQNVRTETSDKKKRASGPGKVKIPDTFQPPSATENSQTPPRATPETRRQSALVADVSQKLLQQLQNIANESIKSEQPLLHGVKVADKKDEFERRASLALVISPPSTTTLKMSPADSGDYEPEKIDSLCESITLLDKLMQTIVEPVKKLEPLEVELLELIKQQQSLAHASTESLATPTSTEIVQQLDREIKRKLSECAEKLDAEYNKRKDSLKQKPEVDSENSINNYLKLDDISRNDRSDSVETIKAESLIDDPQKVHSSLVIDLGPKKAVGGSEKKKESFQKESICVKKDSTTSLNSQMALGPAPIARSYKKVTFTKDGACITETGKIYSAKADDGTVRRIERKSKITHYPNESDTSQGLSKEEKEEEEEEEYYYDGTGQEPSNSGPTWHKETRQASSHRSLVTGKPFEKLIMPSTGFLSDFDDEFERHPLFSRSSGDRESRAQLGQTDSNSSCSSSSTDLLDDIFDTWTGAISVFNKNTRREGSSLFDRHNVLFNRAFGDDPILKQSPLFSPRHKSHHDKRSNREDGSVSGTHRSESVEPSYHKHINRNHRGDRRGGDTSGYDSDYAPPERPASAMAGARDLFGSSNFFSRQSPKLDALFDETFERDFMRSNEPTLSNFAFDPHMSLRQRLAQQHKQLWKGSTPSLFSDQDNQESQFKRQQRQCQNLSHFLRPQELLSDIRIGGDTSVRDRSSSVSQNQSYDRQRQQQQPSSNWAKPPAGGGINKQNLEQSQSSSSFLRKSTAVNAHPSRKSMAQNVTSNTGENPPTYRSSSHSIQKSVSKTSFIASQLSNIQLGNGSRRQQQQVAVSESASFIELKRSPSSQSSKQRQQTFQSTSRIISPSASNASSAFLEGRVSPSNCGQLETDEQEVSGQRSKRSENLDSRVQSWLEESSGNTSSSLSGTQSSVSDITHSIKSNPFSNLYNTLRPSSIHATKQSSMIVSSSSKQSITSDSGSKQRIQKEESMRRQEAAYREKEGVDGQVNKATKVTTATFTLRQKSPNELSTELDSPTVEQQICSVSKQESKVFSSKGKITNISTTAPIEVGKNFDGLNWIKTEESMSSSSRLFTHATDGENMDQQQANNDDSCESTDLESKSSSSLLDQLKSRGYRSMIDQRMVSSSSLQKTNMTTEEQQQHQQATVASSTVVQSSSRVVMSSSSSSGFRVIQKKQQQVSKIEDKSNLNIISDDSASQQTDRTEPQIGGDLHSLEARADSRVEVDEPKLEDCNTVKEGEPLVQIEEKTSQVKEEDEEDEDVREAKANIKPYLDSVKETDMFLKKMHEEEENFERQRQQLFLFNNLMLHTKLNGISSKIVPREFTPTSSSIQYQNTASGNRSAPVGGSLGFNSNSMVEDTQQNNVFIPSVALNFEPTYTIPTINSSSYYTNRSLQQPTSETTFHHRPVNSFTAPIRDPLEPIQPLNVYSDVSPSRFSPNRRCKSQLSDQFNDYKRTRPISANLDLLGSTSNAYFPSRSKRSVSQLRYTPARKISQPIMSEYRSSFVNHHAATAGTNFSSTFDKYNETERSVTSSANLNDADESDDGMSSYRASSYVPKIVPQGIQTHRQGRTLERRSYRKDADLDLNLSSYSRLDKGASSNHEQNCQLSNGIKRRTSLQPGTRKTTVSPNNSTPSSPSSHRKLSLDNTSDLNNGQAEIGDNLNSRLSQLEQRIQENRKRREKLLQQSSSPVNESRRESSAAYLKDNNSPGAPTSSFHSSLTSGLKAKPSRLESMEARIKRKSYCMKIGDCSPERTQLKSQVSLEKWRLTSSSVKSSGATANISNSTSGSPRNSLTNVTNNLYSALSNEFKGYQTPPLLSSVETNRTAQTNGVSQKDIEEQDT